MPLGSGTRLGSGGWKAGNGGILIVCQSTNQIGLRAGLAHFQFLITDVFFFDSFNFGVNGISYFLRRMARQRSGIESEKMGVLVAGKSRETGGEGRDLFVADQGAIK